MSNGQQMQGMASQPEFRDEDGAFPLADWIKDETGELVRRIQDTDQNSLKGLMRALDLDMNDMENVDLAGANLRDEDLRGISFRGADFTAADLRGADLRGCSLEGATFAQARIEGAQFDDWHLHMPELADARVASIPWKMILASTGAGAGIASLLLLRRLMKKTEIGPAAASDEGNVTAYETEQSAPGS